MGFNVLNPFADDILKKGQEMGLQLCPAEVGPQLRLQYDDQPRDESLFIAMKPINLNGWDKIFSVVHNKNISDYFKRLDALGATPQYSFYNLDSKFVFIKPKKR